MVGSWRERWGLDAAVGYSLLARGWQFLAGPISLVLIAHYFSPETQGFFYTFASLMGLQILFEMGLHTVVINMASHEWARIRWVPSLGWQGDPEAGQRLFGFGRQVAVWYLAASVLFGVGIGGGGVWLLGRPEVPLAEWLGPWVALVLLTGLQLWTMPLVSLLEGCDQVAQVQRLRAGQAILGNLAVWAVILGGGGLWAAVASAGVKLLCELALIAHYREFFRPFVARRSSTAAGVDWRTEVWPLQWSIACHSVLQYLAFFMFSPVLFYYHGPQLAGQMGMTWTILTTMQYAAFSWVQTRTPRFGMWIAAREFAELDRVFSRMASIASAVLVMGAASLCGLVAVLPMLPWAWGPALSERLLPWGATCLFASSVCLIGVFQCVVTYLLAHKRNPLLPVSVVGNSLIVAGVMLGGATYGAEGAGVALLSVLAIWTVPAALWIGYRCRREWHQS